MSTNSSGIFKERVILITLTMILGLTGTFLLLKNTRKQKTKELPNQKLETRLFYQYLNDVHTKENFKVEENNEVFQLAEDFPYEPKPLIPLRIRNNNKKLQLINNKGEGDCLFHCIVTALNSIEIKTSVKDLRLAVANSITQDQFENLKAIYNLDDEPSMDVISDYSFMANVETLQDLRNKIMTQIYLGDEMALNALERHTDLKLYVLTMKNNQLIKAVRIDDTYKSEKFSILFLHNVHYQLISFNNNSVFYIKDQEPEELINHIIKNFEN